MCPTFRRVCPPRRAAGDPMCLSPPTNSPFSRGQECCHNTRLSRPFCALSVPRRVPSTCSWPRPIQTACRSARCPSSRRSGRCQALLSPPAPSWPCSNRSRRDSRQPAPMLPPLRSNSGLCARRSPAAQVPCCLLG